MNDPYDQGARYAAKLDPPNFFRRVLPRMATKLVFQEWLDTRTLPFPGEPDRICDTVARFKARRGAQLFWVIVAEFQSGPDPGMLDRLLEYLVRLRRGLRNKRRLDVQ